MNNLRDFRNGIPSPAEDPEVQRVSSTRYGHRTWRIQQLEEPDRYALYDDTFTLIAIGPWTSLQALMNPKERPRYEPIPTYRGKLSLADLGL